MSCSTLSEAALAVISLIVRATSIAGSRPSTTQLIRMGGFASTRFSALATRPGSTRFDVYWRNLIALLMDVRGFTRYRAGCVFEIGCLAKSAAGSRIVFLVDGVTDRGFIGEIWANATHASSVEARSETSALEFVSDNPDAERVCERIIAAFSSLHAVVPMRT